MLPWMHPDAIATGSTHKWPQDVVDGPQTWRRSVYVFIRRSVLMPMLEVFDGPTATASCARRSVTTTAPQALALLNDPFMREQARHFAQRLAAAGPDPTARVHAAFEQALARRPSEREMGRSLEFLEAQEARYHDVTEGDPAQLALVDFCQAVLNLNEFVYVD